MSVVEVVFTLVLFILTGLTVAWYTTGADSILRVLEMGSTDTEDHIPNGENDYEENIPSESVSDSVQKTEDSRKLVLEDEDSEPLMVVSTVPQDFALEQDGSSPKISEGLTRVVSPVVEQLPSFLNEVHDVATTTYEVILKDRFTEEIKNGTLKMMNSKEVQDGVRLNVVDTETGRIVGQGSVRELGNFASYAAGAFQIVSFAVGQAHLAEISNRLDSLQQQTEEILQVLEESQRGALRGKMQYMSDLVPTLKHEPLSPGEVETYHQKLEDIELETLEIAETIKLELDRKKQSVSEVDPSEFKWFYRLDGNRKDLEESLESYSSALRRYQMTLWVRAMAAELKGYLPVEQSQVQKRRTKLQDTLSEEIERHSELEEALSSKAKDLEGTISAEETERKEQRKALRKVHEATSQLQVEFKAIRSAVENGESVREKRKEILEGGVRLLVSKSEDGSLKARLAD